MNYIFISPYFPTNFEHFCTQLKAEKITVLGIGSEPYDSLSQTLKASLTEYYKVNDMENYQEMYQACAFFAHKYGKIDRIESHNEHWLEQDAKLRTDFNVWGLKTEDMTQVKYKSKMKAVFQKAGVKVARGMVVKTMEEAETLIREVGYPVCAKPDNGVGAANTYKIVDKATLVDFFETKPDTDYIMEEYIHGKIHTFDGLVDQEGKVVFYSSFIFGGGILEIVNEDLDVFYYADREPAKDLVKIGLKTVKAFGLKERFFHFEYFRLPDGEIMALEVNIRPPGGLSMDMFNYANDIDLYHQYAKVVSHNGFNAEIARPYFCAYMGRKSYKNYKYDMDQILDAHGDIVVYHQPIASIFAKAIGDYGIIARSPDFEAIKTASQYILERA